MIIISYLKKYSNEVNIFRTLKEMVTMSEIGATETDFYVYCAKISIENHSEFNIKMAEETWKDVRDKEEYSSLFLKLKEKAKPKNKRRTHQNLDAAINNDTVILPNDYSYYS